MKRILLSIWEVFEIVLIAAISVFLIQHFIAQPFIVKGVSMQPTFENNDFLIVDEMTFDFRKPVRGEVIVFRNPRDESEFYIKRVIGLPGEKVEIDGTAIYINNVLLDETYLEKKGLQRATNMAITLEPDQYFVLGDNRLQSSDSREWGPLKESEIIGTVRFRFWPLIGKHLFTYAAPTVSSTAPAN